MYSDDLFNLIYYKIRLIILRMKFKSNKPKIIKIIKSRLDRDYKFESMRFREFSDDEINLVIINEFLDCYTSSQLFLTVMRDTRFLYYRMGYKFFDDNYNKLLKVVNELEFIKL